MSQSSYVIVEQVGHVLQIHLNRPEKKNALITDMYIALIQALKKAEADDDIRVVMLQGHDEVFSAGNDLEEFLSMESEEEPAAMQFLRQLASMEKPIVAAVSSLAVGIGVTMLMHCDLVYAREDTLFRLPFVNLGLVPEAAASLILPTLMGRQRASELLLLGDFFSEEKAKEYGLVNEVLAPEVLPHYAMKKAQQLAAQPQIALSLTKKLINRSMKKEVATRIEEEGELFAARLKTKQVRAILTAVVGKAKA